MKSLVQRFLLPHVRNAMGAELLVVRRVRLSQMLCEFQLLQYLGTLLWHSCILKSSWPLFLMFLQALFFHVAALQQTSSTRIVKRFVDVIDVPHLWSMSLHKTHECEGHVHIIWSLFNSYRLVT